MNSEYIYLGYICGTHGLKGELKIKSLFDKKDLVFKKGYNLYLGPEKNVFKINTYRPHKDYDMVTINSFSDINEVEKFVANDVFIKRDELNLKTNEYLLNDLIGMQIIDNDEIIGKVSDIMYNKGNNLLVVLGKKQFYIPINDYYIQKADIVKNQIITNNAKDLIL